MSKHTEPLEIAKKTYFFLLTDLKHECYFSAILQKEDTFIYCQDPAILQQVSKYYPKSKFVEESALRKIIDKGYISNHKIIVPIDLLGAVNLYQSNELLKQFSAIGMSATILDPNWVIELEELDSSLRFRELSQLFETIITPDEDVNFGLENVDIISAGLFIKDLPEENTGEQQILVVPDFTSYQFYDKAMWLKDVNEATTKDNSESKLISIFESHSESFRDNFTEFLGEVSRAKIVITSRSYVYFICRAMGVNCLIYDPWRFVSTSFSRDMSPKASYVRHKRDILKVLQSDPDAENKRFHLSNNNNSFVSFAKQNKKIESLPKLREEHIVIWGRMPPYTYSGGRYHGWLLAEGLASIGYQVTVYTDNCPYFITDFAHFSGHRRISLVTNSDFKDAKQFPDLTADAIIVIPGMDKVEDMYRGALNYSMLCDAPIGLINFESPNWFNSLVYPPRDEKLWRFWEVISQFSSLILSTTQESTNFAKEYYVNAKENALFTHLYAPINSFYSDKFASITEKEKRVIVFFPRHGYSAHKGWQQIVDCIGDGFAHHTIVFLCGESDLPAEVTDRLFELSQQYQFNIEYKIKIDDEEKFSEMSRASLLVFPSQFEGYGYPPLEALAVGTPCVAFDLPVLRETCGEHLLYAPKGDFETFNHLCNKALRESFRLPAKAVARANEIAHFDSFKHQLSPIIEQLLGSESAWKESLASFSNAQKHIQKAFFNVDEFLAVSCARLSSKITAKAIVKEQLTILKESASMPSTPVASGSRILMLIKSTKALATSLGTSTVSNYYNFAKLKGFLVDVVSEDFALETLRHDFPFCGGKFVSIGQSEIDTNREDATLAIYKLLTQYKYASITIVDGFLLQEMENLQYIPECPKIDGLVEYNSSISNSGDLYSRIFCSNSQSGSVGQTNKSRYIQIPEFVYPSLDRKKWLVTGYDQHLVVYAEEIDDNFHLFIAGVEKIKARLNKLNLKLKVTLISPNLLTDIPYYFNFLRINDNHQLYSFLKRGAIFVNLNSPCNPINTYLLEVSQLVGACVVPMHEESNSEISWQEEICSLLTDAERWKIRRRELFNDSLNKIAEPNYLQGVFPESVVKHVSFLNPIVKAKNEFGLDESPENLAFRHSLANALEKGCLDTAIEISRRANRFGKNLAISLLTFELSLVNRNIELASEIYKQLRYDYPFEGFVLLLGLRIHKAQAKIDAACQSAYYAVMLNSEDYQCIADASLCSVCGVRRVDEVIHNILREYVGENSIRFKNEKFNSLKDELLIEALIEEYEQDASN